MKVKNISAMALSVVLALAFAPGMALSQNLTPQTANIEGFLEGPISDIDVIGGTMKVNGIVVIVPPGTPISSPTKDITIQGLAGLAGDHDNNPATAAIVFPGRTQPGFIGGTCLCAVEVNPDTGVHTVTDIVVEVAENVMVSSVHSLLCTNPACNDPGNYIRIGSGIRTSRLNDNNTGGLMPSLTPRPANRGFPLDMTSAEASVNTVAPSDNHPYVGRSASLEGYFGTANSGGPGGPEKEANWFLFTIEGGRLSNQTTPDVSVDRAQCEFRADKKQASYNVEGFTHGTSVAPIRPATGTVQLRNGANNANIGAATNATVDVGDTFFGVYRNRVTVTAGSCQSTIRVRFTPTGGAAVTTGEIPVDVLVR